MGESQENRPHPASVARFARKGPRLAHWGYAVAALSVWAMLVASAFVLHHSAARWVVFVVLAAIYGAILLVNRRALRQRRDA